MDYVVSFSLRQRDLPEEARNGLYEELAHVRPAPVFDAPASLRLRCEVRAHGSDEAVAYLSDRVGAYLRTWCGFHPRILDVTVAELVSA